MTLRLAAILGLTGACVVIAAGAVWLTGPGEAPGPRPDPALVAEGRVVFEAHCAACHAMSTNGRAPGIAGLMGRQVGTDAFNYSAALRRADFVWDAASLEAFLVDPRGYLPDNQMVFYGLEDAEQRAALIAYISSLR